MTNTKDVTQTPEVKSGTVAGFKGFDKDLKCRGFQYEVGATAEHKGDLSLCAQGLHFVENPAHVFGYYPPHNSRYAVVEAEGVSSNIDGGDSKRVASRLLVKAELTLHALIEATVKFTMEKVNFTAADKTNTEDKGSAANSGESGSAANSGYGGSAANSGESGSAANSGESGSAANSGEQGVAANFAPNGMVKGSLGSWIVCDEWVFDDKADCWKRLDLRSAKVDGKKIKADTFYTLKGGKFVQAVA